jgi:hypothetical protein
VALHLVLHQLPLVALLEHSCKVMVHRGLIIINILVVLAEARAAPEHLFLVAAAPAPVASPA